MTVIPPAPSIPPTRDYRCVRCNYGAILDLPSVSCPMCGSRRWEHALRRAPGLLEDLASATSADRDRPAAPVVGEG